MGSFFKKPAWAAKPAVTNDEFYRRSEQTYSDIIAANKAHKKHKKSQITSESVGPSDLLGEALPEDAKQATRAKRARLSDESPDKEIVIPTTSPSKTKSSKGHHAPSTPPGHNAEVRGSSHPAIENDHLQTSSLDAPDLPLTVGSTDAETSINKESKPHETSITTSNQDDSERPNHTESSYISPQPLKPSVASTNDPAVEILITSEIRNTKPLLVRRKMSQGLREVRLEWCKRQGLATGNPSPVYLTWKGRRLFDVTTCKSLGIQQKSTGFGSVMDDDFMEGQELRIHMVAVTDDPLLNDRPSGPGEQGDQAPTSQSPKVQHTEDDEPMKLTFRSPGLNDLRVKARPKTRVSKLISIFRETQNVSADQAVFFIFDGDRLEPDACLRDYEVADLDLVDVQIQPLS